MTQNMFKAVSNSHTALQSMWSSFAALGKGRLGVKLGEQIAVAIANSNRCEYCLAAHTVLGQAAGASAEEMQAVQRAQVEAGDLHGLRELGFDDELIVEIMAHVALNVYTNYINVALDVPVDFPKVALV